ncbi:hypothetical protein HanIR_Chr12g0588521 [Helianthus annuus]|nr:hypothetical protein HanIR_Chr12g0588521 [Helianthus annuus]
MEPDSVVLGRRRGSNIVAVVKITGGTTLIPTTLIPANLGFFHHHRESLHHSHTQLHQIKFTTSHHHHHHELLRRTLNGSRHSFPSRLSTKGVSITTRVTTSLRRTNLLVKPIDILYADLSYSQVIVLL